MLVINICFVCDDPALALLFTKYENVLCALNLLSITVFIIPGFSPQKTAGGGFVHVSSPSRF